MKTEKSSSLRLGNDKLRTAQLRQAVAIPTVSERRSSDEREHSAAWIEHRNYGVSTEYLLTVGTTYLLTYVPRYIPYRIQVLSYSGRAKQVRRY